MEGADMSKKNSKEAFPEIVSEHGVPIIFEIMLTNGDVLEVVADATSRMWKLPDVADAGIPQSLVTNWWKKGGL